MSKKILAVFAAVIVTILFFQNCGKGFQTISDLEDNVNATDFDKVYANNFSEVKDEKCLQKSNFDACVFLKDPYEATSQGNPYESWLERLPAAQLISVKLPFTPEQLHDEGTLTVMDSKGVRFATSPQSKLRVDAVSNGIAPLTQVMIQYWFQKTMSLLGQVRLTRYLQGTGLKVIVDAPVTGWIANRNVIALGKHNNTSIALDGSIFVQLLGEAMIHHATQERLVAPDDVHHQACYSEKNKLVANECCTTTSGCSKALTIGLSDF